MQPASSIISNFELAIGELSEDIKRLTQERDDALQGKRDAEIAKETLATTLKTCFAEVQQATRVLSEDRNPILLSR